MLAAENQAGGFSPGLAARCRLDDGSRVFLKAVSPAQNPQACRIHRREAEVASHLPRSVPAPRLRHVHDDGEWVALVLDDIDGRQPREPWTPDDLALVLPALRAIHDSVDPSPVALQSVQDRHRPVFNGWRRLAGGDGVASLIPPTAIGLVDEAAELEEGWEAAAAGDTLLHADIRADNLLVDGERRVWLVDWPWACVGAAFVDLALFLPSVGLGGGPTPAKVTTEFGLFEDVAHEQLVAVVAAVSGFFTRMAQDPDPPGLPRVRAFQRAQAEVAVDWLRTLMGA